jgi:hypothetical protein
MVDDVNLRHVVETANVVHMSEMEPEKRPQTGAIGGGGGEGTRPSRPVEVYLIDLVGQIDYCDRV